MLSTQTQNTKLLSCDITSKVLVRWRLVCILCESVYALLLPEPALCYGLDNKLTLNRVSFVFQYGIEPVTM